MKIRPATASDNLLICKLCEHAMPGHIQIALERNPNFFAGSMVQCENPEVYVCTNDEDTLIVGLFSIGSRRVWLDGVVKNIRYFSDLRIADNMNRAQALFAICNYINTHQILHDTLAQTIVFDDNGRMKKVIDLLNLRSEKHHVFRYFKHGTYKSYMLNIKNKQAQADKKCIVRNANRNDLQKIEDYIKREASKINFFPYYSIYDLSNAYHKGLSIDDFYIAEKDHQIIGLCAVWDQTAYKQTRVKSYSTVLRLTRPLVNILSKLTGGFVLPAPGKVIPYVSLHSILVKDHDADVLKVLVNKILVDFKDSEYQYLLCGMAESSPLQKGFNGYSNKRSIKGNCFLVSENKPEYIDSSEFYLELGRI